MATSPNFSWPEPDNTDLVKNGALAIRTAVDAIDSSMADLKGGTSGQVLTKASGTDMDFTWSAASAGSSYVAGKNGILNSNFSVAQRGTSFTASSVYTLDRWFCDGQSNRTISQVVTGDTTNLPFIQYAGRVQRNSGTTGTVAIGLTYSLETLDSIKYAGQTVTLSFYARAGANYSAASSALNARLYSGTGTNQRRDFSTAFTGEANPINQTATLTTTWQRFSYSATVASTATELALQFFFTPSGTAGANDYFDITGVQLEIASSVSAYSPNASSYQAELQACQRYYEKSYTQSDAPATVTQAGAKMHPLVGSNVTSYLLHFGSYKVEKRATPSITIYDFAGNSGKVTVMNNSTTANTDNIAGYVDTISSSSFRIYETGTSCGGYQYHYTASAEL